MTHPADASRASAATANTVGSAAATSAVPELGPSLGRLTDPPRPGRSRPAGARSLGIALDDLRLELVSRLFDLAGASRQFAAAGDSEGMVQSLGRVAWLGAWEQMVVAAAARLTDAVNAGFRQAAAESRLPRKRLDLLLLTPDDTRAIVARLGAGAGATEFVAALDALEVTAVAARGAWSAWQDAVGAAARRLETAWAALEAAFAAEETRWSLEIERVRAWRRPAWPLWIITAGILAPATYLGLVLGGYLPVPEPLHGVADFVWGLGWI